MNFQASKNKVVWGIVISLVGDIVALYLITVGFGHGPRAGVSGGFATLKTALFFYVFGFFIIFVLWFIFIYVIWSLLEK